MDIEAYREYCLRKKGVTESTPFPKLPHILVFKVLKKMFTATDIRTFASFSIKHHPEWIEELRETYSAVTEPSYFSKNHWCNVEMDGSITDETLCAWLDISYQLALKNLSKKQQKELL